MAAYTIYELLTTLIQRVGWPTEQEKVAALESVEHYRSVSLFGNMATLIECPHDRVTSAYSRNGTINICVDCKKSVTNVGDRYV